MKSIALAIALLTPALSLATVPQPAAAQDLTIGVAAAVSSIDPHFYNLGPNNAIAMHIFDQLVQRDSRARPQPGLAESWRAISDTEWEFRLRAGVTWHDGRRFTADDVIFSYARAPNVPNSPGGFGGFLRTISRIEVPEPNVLRIHTHTPHPLLPLDLASVAIVARHAAEGAATEDFHSGRAAIGTGPYRLVSFRPGDRVELARNPGWWGGVEPWARVSYRSILNDGARTAALLAGDVDIIDQIPGADMPRLRRDARLSITEIPSLRTMYLGMDFSRAGAPPGVTDNAGTPLPANPFLDVRVRRALSLAINRAALVDRVMDGGATTSAQWLPEGAFGFNPGVPVPAYDPDGARRLLAEAGFPNGFRLTITSPNDRWPNDSRMAQGIAQMLTRVGLRTTVEAMPFAAFAPRAARQEFGLRFAAWSSSTGEASNFLVNVIGTFDRERRTGASNSSRYSNPTLDALVSRGAATMNDPAREAIWHQAVALVNTEVAVVPLVQLINNWALRRSLVHEPRMDERTVAMGVRPAAR